jgi:hypothetical protein
MLVASQNITQCFDHQISEHPHINTENGWVQQQEKQLLLSIRGDEQRE